jgi:hypothetical protein
MESFVKRHLLAAHSVLAHDQWRFQKPIARVQDRDGADRVRRRKTERRAEGIFYERFRWLQSHDAAPGGDRYRLRAIAGTEFDSDVFNINLDCSWVGMLGSIRHQDNGAPRRALPKVST